MVRVLAIRTGVSTAAVDDAGVLATEIERKDLHAGIPKPAAHDSKDQWS